LSEIFLSFSGDKSQKFAEKLQDLIKKIGLGTIFLANTNIKSGDNWLEKIYANLKECRVGIVIFTKENRDNNKWLYLEYGVLSYKQETKTDENLKTIPIYLDFTEDDWKDNPLVKYQSVSFSVNFDEAIDNLLVSINDTLRKKKGFNASEKRLEEPLLSIINELKNIILSPEEIKDDKTKINSVSTPLTPITQPLNKSVIAQVLENIHSFIKKNQCILYNYIEYDKVEKYLENEVKIDEVTLSDAIAYLSDTNHLIFTEEEGLDGYPIEYIGLSAKGQKIIRRRKVK